MATSTRTSSTSRPATTGNPGSVGVRAARVTRLRVRDGGDHRALLDHLTDEREVVAGAVYAAGFSAGGRTGWNLAVRASDQFAAVASVGGPYIPGSARPDAPSEVVEYRVEGLRHEWPSEVVPGTATSGTTWEFFTSHPG